MNYFGPGLFDALRSMQGQHMGGEGMFNNMTAPAYAQDNRFVGMNHNRGKYLPDIARRNAMMRSDEREAMSPKFAHELLQYLGLR